MPYAWRKLQNKHYPLSELGSPEGIAVDWVSRLVFWTDSALKRLEVAKLDGSLRKVLLDKNIQNPRGIAVNPELGFVRRFSPMICWHPRVFLALQIHLLDRLESTESSHRTGQHGWKRATGARFRETRLTEWPLLWSSSTWTMLGWCEDENYRMCSRRWIQSTSAPNRSNYDDLRSQWWTSICLLDRLVNVSRWPETLLGIDFETSSNKIGRIDKTPSRTPDSILLPPGGNGKLYGLVAVKDSCPVEGKDRSASNGDESMFFIIC